MQGANMIRNIAILFENKILKSFLWFFITLCVGLSPTLAIFIISHIFKITFSIEKLILDGILVSFSVVLVSTMVVDYYLFSNNSQNSFIMKIVFSIIPIIIVLVDAMFLASCYLVTKVEILEQSFDAEFVIMSSFVILLITCGYAVLIKLDSFTT
jgi:hypothetical protein